MRIDSDVRRTIVEIKVDGTRGDWSIVRQAPGKELWPMCLSNCQSDTSVSWDLASREAHVERRDSSRSLSAAGESR